MNTILTDDERRAAIDAASRASIFPTPARPDAIARATEAAVLAKLREQEPVHWRYASGDGYRLLGANGGLLDLSKTDVYLHPAAPLPAVVQVPQGWKLVPVEPTDAMVDAARSQSSFPDGVYAAMLRATPEAPAQAVVQVPSAEECRRCPGDDAKPWCDHTKSGWCARSNPSLMVTAEAPEQGGDLDALLNRFAQSCAFGDDQARRVKAANAIKDLFTRSVLEAQAIPAPWREAVKVALTLAANRLDRLALELPHGSCARQDAEQWADEARAALAQLDALEGEE